MKKFSKITVIVLMLVSVICAVAACRSVDGISVDGTDTPRTTYVQGQDLDLSIGKILVKTNKGTEEITLDSKGVTVTGYDKNKLGDQELTVKYEDKTATFTVKVVARIALDSKCETEYFVGEAFNKSAGRIIVADDSGATKTVDMSSDGVDITGFDSSTAGKDRSVTVSYGGYTDTFTVNVYSIDSARLTAPRKKDYKSHETDIDLTGGYIMLSNGSFTKNVRLTSDMVSGFAPNAATESNAAAPLSQKITVSYAQYNGSFNISVTYTDVSRIQKIAETLADIDWSGDTYPEISTQKGEDALTAAELYLGLSSGDRAYISEDDKNAIIRAAAVYGRKIWRNDAAAYSDAFTVDDEGAVTFVCNTKADAEAGANALGSSSCTLMITGELLADIASEFGDTVLIGEDKVSEYLDSVCTPAELTVIMASLEYMIKFDAALADSKIDEWTKENYTNYADEIAAVLATIDGSDFKSSRDRAIYEIVLTEWRSVTYSTAFDAMYAYCYHGEHLSDAGAILNLYLPAKVQVLYNYTLLTYMEVITSAAASGRVAYETTPFMIYYDSAMKALEDVSENGDDVDKWLSSVLTVNIPTSQQPETLLGVLSLCRTSQYGYIYHHNAWFEDTEFTGLWTKYLDVCREYAQYLSDNEDDDTAPAYWEVKANGDKIKDMFETFVNMSSPRQMGFLRSLNVSYMNMLPPYALYYGNGTVYSEFIYLIANYYENALPEKALPVFRNLLLAVESYSRMFALSSASESFTNQIVEATKAYDALEQADKDAFDVLLKSVYDKYTALPAQIQAASSYELGDNKAKFDALAEALYNVNLAATNIANKRPVYNMLFAAYEQAEILANEILSGGDADLINAYYNLGYYEYRTQSGTVKWSLEYAMYNMRGIYVTYLTNTVLTQNSGLMWYTYNGNDMGLFYGKAAHVMWTYNNNLGTGTKKDYDKNSVLAAMEAFRNMSDMGKIAANILSQNSNYYYSGLDAYFKSVLLPDKEELDPEDYAVYEVATRLMTAERQYVAYLPYALAEGDENKPEGFETEAAAAKKAFTDAMDDVERLYGNLSQTEQTLFNEYLKDAYDYYKVKSAELKSTAASSDVTEAVAA